MGFAKHMISTLLAGGLGLSVLLFVGQGAIVAAQESAAKDPSAAEEVNQDIAAEMFARGFKAEQAGKSGQAAKQYESAAAGGYVAAYGRLGDLARKRGSHKTAASWYEKGAKSCDGTSQLGLALAHRMGQGREADGDLAYAWLISAQRAKSDWSADELQRLSDLERDIPAYMSAQKINAAYCLGLDFYLEACGKHHLISRVERWVYCE